MNTRIEGNFYAYTKTNSPGRFTGTVNHLFSVTVTLRSRTGADTLPTTKTLTDTWSDYATTCFESCCKNTWFSSTRGPRRELV